jgi:hypothetical protein
MLNPPRLVTVNEMAVEETFFQKHREGIIAIWRREAREWWRLHYVEANGHEPPDGWWEVNPGTAAGGQLAPGMMQSFGYFDGEVMRAYFREMEARYRAEAGLPARGDGWVSETHLANLVSDALPGLQVVREARLDWLKGQRLDIYVPGLSLAIEYQGIQHYEPIDLFGGADALTRRQAMDERKRLACEEAGVRLIVWRYDEPVTLEAVHERTGSATTAQ